MKQRFLSVALLLIVAVLGFAQVDNVYYLDEAVLAWDPVTEDVDGQPLLETDQVSYDVFLYDSTETLDDQDPSLLVSVGNTSDTQIAISFDNRDRSLYYVGVRVVVLDESGNTTVSPIAWSYDPEVTAELPFGYIPLGGVLVLPLPTGLRTVQ